ncbi:glycosyl hydrolase [Fibrella aquatilis]|uniref:Glycosyl hydrolase n=1 Tax=Fibrella aquatilis TaxID=2817059 RepID=A0A939JYN9_9BACT|nr:glycosyl hydrolase [Fibrella aquatilis]MBO0932304.1 glycosyl hydrolase [Fibrella aquatilis]
MLQPDLTITPAHLATKLQRFWAVSAQKITLLDQAYDPASGSPVFTVQGKYTTRGWTEWTQGFQFGSAILQFDATGETDFLELGRRKTLKLMAPHVSHVGVHDHGFNNVSTYGNLLRLMREGRIPRNDWEASFYEMALKVSGAVQANRWTTINTSTAAGTPAGFIYSFNGPHSLFVDTIRSCRSLIVSHLLGHTFQGEGDKRIDLLGRALGHMQATAQFSVYYGEGRDTYDVWGRTAHESIFNVNDGQYRCPNSQQGYTGFSTWTRGLAWAMCGFAEELEALTILPDEQLTPFGGRGTLEAMLLKAARATCDFYLDNTPTDGIPYWDTGAPNLYKLGDYLGRPANPFNDHEPVDSSAAAIAAQGLLRLGHYLMNGKISSEGIDNETYNRGKTYWQAGLTVLSTLLDEPYLSMNPQHQGLLLHSIYHRPNGWDYVPAGSNIPYGESSMWGDYHLREAALYVQRIIDGGPYYTFFGRGYKDLIILG